MGMKKRKHRLNPFLGYIIPVRKGRCYILKSMTCGMVAPIGPRLHRAEPWPLDTDTFPTKEQALIAADKANQYLNATPPW
jgi:hypothetical protein